MKPLLKTIKREQTYYGMLMVALLTALIIIHLSLYPYLGWRNIGIGHFEYLTGSWIPVYQTILWDDIFANILAYIPLGLSLTLGLAQLPRRMELILAPILALALSLLLEATQTFLPTRVPSKMDVLTNFIGALIGTLLAFLIDYFRVWPPASRQWLHHNAWIGIGIIGLWLISLFAPTGQTFILGIWFGNWILENPLTHSDNLMGLPEWFILSAEQWLLPLGSFCFLLAILLIGLLQVKRKRPKFWLSINLLVTSVLISQAHWLANAGLQSWLEAIYNFMIKNYIPLISSLAIVIATIEYRPSNAFIARSAIALILFGWAITILFPGIYPPELQEGGGGVIRGFRDLQQASAWVGNAWPLLTLIVLTFVCVDNAQNKR